MQAHRGEVEPADTFVVDGGLVSSRDPGDLPAFAARIVEVFARGTAASKAA